MAKRVPWILTLVLPCLMLVSAAARATEWYVSPSGHGDGSIGNPWSLDTALGSLGAPAAAHPGDTIWLRGGTYTGTHVSYLFGTSSNPIIVRQYPGEHAILDGGNSGGLAVLQVNGAYTWFWGFEVTSSDPKRTSSSTGSFPGDIGRGDGVASGVNTAGIKLINLVIHDTRQGISAFTAWSDTEVNGCLVYYNGWDGADNGHGHGIYTQNQTGSKKFFDSIIFQNFGEGIQAYGSSSSHLDNFDIEGVVSFSNGELATHGSGRNILVGGDSVTHNPILANNVMYYSGWNQGPASALDLGYGAGCSNATVTGNYVANKTYFVNCSPTSMTGNTFFGTVTGLSPAQYANNTYLYTSRPTGAKIFVRPNQYEPGRGNVTIFNWDGTSTVSVDLSGVLTAGQGYEVRNAQDFFGAPVLTGTYDGNPVAFPTGALSVAAPVGWGAPSATGPEFNVYVVLPASGGSGGGGGGGTPPPSGLPTPWAQSDIGPVGHAGDGGASSGSFTVSGSGADIWNNSDEFHYVYQPLAGDGTIVARVAGMDNTDPWAKAGVMIRETLGAGSTHAMTVVTPGNGIAFQRREATGAASVHTPGVFAAAPYWVKLVRSGNTFTGYSSTDGSNWASVGSDTITMAPSVYVGLAVTSHNDGLVCSTTIDNVSVSTTGGGGSGGSGGGGGGTGSVLLRIGGEQGVLTAPMAVRNDSSAFGGQYISTSTAESGSASWTFTVPESGTYYVWARVKTTDGVHDSFYVSMDSGSEDVFDAAGSQSWGSAWRWTVLNGRGSSGQQFAINPRTFSLSAGSHTLKFRAREITPLDRIIITDNPSFVATESP